jgi:hypothetical protein
MNREIRVLDVVALTEDISDRGLLRGQVGPWWSRLVRMCLRWSLWIMTVEPMPLSH